MQSDFRNMRLITIVLTLFISYTSSARGIYVKESAAGVSDGTSWDNAFTLLNVALDSASYEDSVFVAAGRYLPEHKFNVPSGVRVFGGLDGSTFPVNLDVLNQRNFDHNVSMVTADVLNDDYKFENDDDNYGDLFYLQNTDSSTVIDGFLISGGNKRTWYGGAGVYMTQADGEIRNCIFRWNQTETNGGALSVFGGNVVLENLIFDHNKSAVSFNFSTVVAKNILLINNLESIWGNEVLSINNSDVTLINATIAGNETVEDLHAVEIFSNKNPGSTISFTNVLIANNSSSFNEEANLNIIENGFINFTVDHSLIIGSGGSDNWMLEGATDLGGNLDSDPRLVNPDTGDVRLFSGSPGLGAGDQIQGIHIGYFQGVDSPVAVGEVNEAIYASAYPNPVSAQLIIESEYIIEIIQVINQQGVIVDEITPMKTTYNLNVAGYEYGLYVTKLKTKDGSAVIHFLVE